jgi:hypothetical protein
MKTADGKYLKESLALNLQKASGNGAIRSPLRARQHNLKILTYISIASALCSEWGDGSGKTTL